ncbi:MAG: STAS domain-containing protein [Pseudomonadota bacterium]
MVTFKEEKNRLYCTPRQDMVASAVSQMRDTFIAKMEKEPERPWEEIVLDLSQVEVMDSIGINLMLGLYKESKSKDKLFKVIGCNDKIIKVIKLFKLDKTLNIDMAKQEEL